MKKKYTLGIIGGGFMAQAIVEGALSCGYLAAQDILISEPNPARAAVFTEKGIDVNSDNAKTASNCRYLLLSVKPQVFQNVAEKICGMDMPTIITIMAGVKKATVRKLLGNETMRIARVMPNLACSIGVGMTGADMSELTKSEAEFVAGLFSSVGNISFVEEDLLNAVTAISGSGPAYVFLFLQALERAGIEQGLSEAAAKEFALQTFSGGLELAKNNSNGNLDCLIAAVSSKGGTTAAALESFRKDGFEDAVLRAVAAAVKRGEELSE